jgi:tetratricopeptide (TPR) repeat protein
MERTVARHRAQVREAGRWLVEALEEAERRDERAFPGTYVACVLAAMSLGEWAEARVALTLARREADAPGWDLERLDALLHLFEGDLESAVEHAFRAVWDAPPRARKLAQYALALILDRAGTPWEAAAELRRLRISDPDHGLRRTLEQALPVYERLYFRALDHEAQGFPEIPNALRLWDAYLARPEPLAPERELAQRHRSALQTPIP